MYCIRGSGKPYYLLLVASYNGKHGLSALTTSGLSSGTIDWYTINKRKRKKDMGPNCFW